MLSLLPLALALVPQDPIVVRDVLAIEPLGVRRRSAVYTDALEARLARGEFAPPSAGDTIRSTTGDERAWASFAADENGWFSGTPFRSGWAWTTVEVPASGAWRLDASGHALVFVNGEPRMGDVYGLGTTRVPLALESGSLDLLFRCGRGRMRATLEPAPAPMYFEEKDRTMPDVIRGEGGTLLLGQIVANATARAASGLFVVARFGDAPVNETWTEVPTLLPSSYRKCQVSVALTAAATEAFGDKLELSLALIDANGDTVHTTEVALDVRSPHEKHLRTFQSDIDGSVQYYAVTPRPADAQGDPALFLSLHGASVEARNQAYSYAPKDWGVVVAPTNRRPFGFDWEDWGRMDALEVLAIATERYAPDPRRVYLTGHSMGGHGTWQLGAHFPDRFAAIAPSAGWRDFWNYAGAGGYDEKDPIGAMLARSANASRTLLLERNYLASGVYVLHGDADDNVRVSEARAMRERLGTFHPNFAYYERPGAGHWWGNECMDWPPLFAFLKDNVAKKGPEVREIDFTTINPGISSSYEWVSVEIQDRPMEPSRVVARLDADERTVRLELENVSRIGLDLSRFVVAEEGSEPVLPGSELIDLVIGEQTIRVSGSTQRFFLARSKDRWETKGALAGWYKGPHRSGPFKDAFRHRMAFVYGTQGSESENAWARNKARYDHEQWRYRGNGAVDVIADVDFDPTDEPDRGIVLYGNQDTNGAWDAVLDTRAFELRRGRLRMGERELKGDDLALLVTYPRRDSNVASVAVIGATGAPGAAATTNLPIFVSGVAYADWTVLSAGFLEEGLPGFLGTGFFRADWSTNEGAEPVWR